MSTRKQDLLAGRLRCGCGSKAIVVKSGVASCARCAGVLPSTKVRHTVGLSAAQANKRHRPKSVSPYAPTY